MFRVLFGLTLLFYGVSCGSSGEETGLMLIVDADSDVRGRTETLRILIRGEKGAQVNELAPIVYGDDETIDWPRSLALVPLEGDSNRTVSVHVGALEADAVDAFVEARVIFGYERDRRTSIRVFLESRCVGVICGAEETCFQGECRDARDAWQPTQDDGGVIDMDGGMDGSVDMDGGTDGGADSGPCSGMPLNACGGCAVLEGPPGGGCGPCKLDTYSCLGENNVECSGETYCWDSVSVGSYHGCARMSTGRLFCWGFGDNGRLGDATIVNSAVPVPVLQSGQPAGGAFWSDWSRDATASSHSCGLRTNGSAWCWGYGNFGKRGDGTATANGVTPARVLEAGQSAGGTSWSDWIALAGGGEHTCGIRQDKSAWCWGYGRYGQRGDATQTDGRFSPRQVVQADQAAGGAVWNDWAALTGGFYHTCGLRTDGTAWCWGRGTYGQRGDGLFGDTYDVRDTPVQVLRDSGPSIYWTDWTKISSFGYHTCGIRTDGSAWCWGYGGNGERGDGNTASEASRPVRVWAAGAATSTGAWADWTAVSAGWSHTCGIRTDGTAWCWGNGTSGQRGDGGTTATRTTPTQVLAAGSAPGGAAWSDWTAIAAGASFTCGLRADKTLWCWGARQYGRLGDGLTAPSSSTPVQVLDPAL
jgi:alpha-tubulin suppressor-like RCC1 family protein